MNRHRTAYRWALRLLLPVALLRLAVKGVRRPAYFRGWGERLGYVPELQHSIWLHAVSVGEVRAAAPLIEALVSRYPDRPLVVTTTTPTGASQVYKLFGGRVQHAYFGYDLPGIVDRVLRRFDPAILIVMETEVWPTLYQACNHRAIPVCLVNGRLSERSMRRYQRVLTLACDTFGAITLLAAQTPADASRFITLGARPAQTRVLGNLKFDLEVPPAVSDAGAALRQAWGAERPVWVAASTHKGEDDVMLDAHEALTKSFPDLLLILVPRHPERGPAVARACRRRGWITELRSEGAGSSRVPRVLVADTLGELTTLMAASDIVVMGGSFVKSGGHNILEACAVSRPVIFGPHMFNFSEVADTVVGAGAGVQVMDSMGLIAALSTYLANPAARQVAGQAGLRVMDANRGAVSRTLSALDAYLDPGARTR